MKHPTLTVYQKWVPNLPGYPNMAKVPLYNPPRKWKVIFSQNLRTGLKICKVPLYPPPPPPPPMKSGHFQSEPHQDFRFPRCHFTPAPPPIENSSGLQIFKVLLYSLPEKWSFSVRTSGQDFRFVQCHFTLSPLEMKRGHFCQHFRLRILKGTRTLWTSVVDYKSTAVISSLPGS